ncbi:thiamine pyrophosphate-dependent dehydrogenase E1 component subunit alpha [Methylobrevis pamukkalensis]|uniref:Acetoin:2,6-dichlorophenolindophenol oxidoreductase subunit alpha n=1 Tax=Methylobrevis pamukkalensis TaxID=1439726 RepID=A0A1E3H4Z0_9HYPH|nr:thiamine pyrophosphate-dependent dehydrogenase E1 component subunit alpha [Methylobrevis pamukkalensis]ODN71225.1 Acetoin:2,6-dichlorophenolindophenol oxidoreductase subunit alpha [Methylobrevis pamukkalensis]
MPDPSLANAPSIEEHLEIFRKMVVVRRLEEALREMHRQGKTRGPIHCCDGQEAVGVAATAMLRPTDLLTSTHRGHANYVGKGLSTRAIVAEIFGRATGCCGGRAGHMLVADIDHGLIGGNAIVGAGIPAATGMAAAIQLKKLDDVAMCIFGDGAAQTGICHEAMNIAALWALPVVFVLEHNAYGLTVAAEKQSSIETLSVRAAGYGMPGVTIDGNDAVVVYRTIADAVARARRGEGPSLVECRTYRMTGFSTSDMGGYQSADEMAAWADKDPIRRTWDVLAAEVGAARLDALTAEAEAEVRDAFETALSDPFPVFEPHPASNPHSVALS